jgi:hypothetical protein
VQEAAFFDSVPGAQVYGNVVINNRLTNNGLPGIAMHSHTPGRNLNDNLIIGNHTSGTRCYERKMISRAAQRPSLASKNEH